VWNYICLDHIQLKHPTPINSLFKCKTLSKKEKEKKMKILIRLCLKAKSILLYSHLSCNLIHSLPHVHAWIPFEFEIPSNQLVEWKMFLWKEFSKKTCFLFSFQSGSNQISRMLLGTMVFWDFVEEIDHQEGMSNWNGQNLPLLFTAALFFYFRVFNVVSISASMFVACFRFFKVFFFFFLRRD